MGGVDPRGADFIIRRKCWRKKGYRTSREAQVEIKRVYKTEHLHLYKYRCESCHEFHLTKQSSAKGKIL